jgi:hypothetical protein
MFATEIQHFLGLGDAADQRTGEVMASKQKAEGGDGKRFLWRSDERKISIAAQQV